MLLTGATGFLGGWLARMLVGEGTEIVAVVRPDSATGGLATHGDRVQLMSAADGGLADRLAEIPEDEPCDAVVHFATHYGRGGATAADVARVNVAMSLDLLEWSIARGTPTFVNIDTCFTPDYPYLRPYTLSKKQFVAWGETLCATSPTRFVNLVLQHPFGPGDRPGKFVPWVVEQCLSGVGAIDLTSGEQEKDFIYAADVADACLCVLRSADQLPVGASTLEVGCGETVSVRRFVETAHRLSGSKAELRFGALAQRPGEVTRSVADTSALRALGWAPKTTLEDGLRQTISAVRNERSGASA